MAASDGPRVAIGRGALKRSGCRGAIGLGLGGLAGRPLGRRGCATLVFIVDRWCGARPRLPSSRSAARPPRRSGGLPSSALRRQRPARGSSAAPFGMAARSPAGGSASRTRRAARRRAPSRRYGARLGAVERPGHGRGDRLARPARRGCLRRRDGGSAAALRQAPRRPERGVGCGLACRLRSRQVRERLGWARGAASRRRAARSAAAGGVAGCARSGVASGPRPRPAASAPARRGFAHGARCRPRPCSTGRRRGAGRAELPLRSIAALRRLRRAAATREAGVGRRGAAGSPACRAASHGCASFRPPPSERPTRDMLGPRALRRPPRGQGLLVGALPSCVLVVAVSHIVSSLFGQSAM